MRVLAGKTKSVRRGEQRHELVILDLPRPVLIDILDQFLNVYRHLKLMLNDLDETRRVNRTLFICFSA